MLRGRSEVGLTNSTKFCCASHSYDLQYKAIARLYGKLLAVVVCP
jgi:hypothetical protein